MSWSRRGAIGAAFVACWIFLTIAVVVGLNKYMQHEAEHAALRQIIQMINAQAAQARPPATPGQ